MIPPTTPTMLSVMMMSFLPYRSPTVLLHPPATLLDNGTTKWELAPPTLPRYVLNWWKTLKLTWLHSCNNVFICTQVFHVPFEERRDASHKFGEGESNHNLLTSHNCLHIMKETGTVIEISVNKDQSLTFLVQGKPAAVSEARRRILQQFQTQVFTCYVICTVSLNFSLRGFVL